MLRKPDWTIRRRRGALGVSLLAHGLAMLALVNLLHRTQLPQPPPEAGIAVVFVPMFEPVVAPASPSAPPVVESPPAEQAAPLLAQPEPKTEEVSPPIAQPAPLPQPAPKARPPPHHLAAIPPGGEGAHPPAPSATSAAASTAPLLPAHPVAGMESDRPPIYPEIARRRGQQGRVMLEVNVSADGQPVAVSVAESSGFSSLDAAALTAVQRWRFVPATRAGVPVPAVAEVPVRFRLTD